MNSTPGLEEIIETLKRSGYLMEQEVATQLEALDFHVWTNWAYQDMDEGKSREIDVRAIKRVAYNEEKKLSAFVEIIAECKNSTNPFVFIGRRKNKTDNQFPPQEFVFPISQYEARKETGKGSLQVRQKPAFFYLEFDKIHYDFKKSKKAVQFCRIDRKGSGWQANHSGLYDSIFLPMAKAITARMNDIPFPTRKDTWRNFWLFVPMVIVSGDIFYVDSMKSEPIPQEVDYVTFKREIKSGQLNGIFALEFVRQNQLESFVSDGLSSLAAKMADLTTNQADFVLRKEIPWDD